MLREQSNTCKAETQSSLFGAFVYGVVTTVQFLVLLSRHVGRHRLQNPSAEHRDRRLEIWDRVFNEGVGERGIAKQEGLGRAVKAGKQTGRVV